MGDFTPPPPPLGLPPFFLSKTNSPFFEVTIPSTETFARREEQLALVTRFCIVSLTSRCFVSTVRRPDYRTRLPGLFTQRSTELTPLFFPGSNGYGVVPLHRPTPPPQARLFEEQAVSLPRVGPRKEEVPMSPSPTGQSPFPPDNGTSGIEDLSKGVFGG